ncbi:hypothetical protein AcV7_001736 [Taiwanofungus camphoratus]|nr:hypothetical protein AcV7_001736 [Antrodia cinnamomea]
MTFTTDDGLDAAFPITPILPGIQLHLNRDIQTQESRPHSDVQRKDSSSSILDDSMSTSHESRSASPASPVLIDIPTTSDRDKKVRGTFGSGSKAYREGQAEELAVNGAAGRLPPEVYDRTMSWWRAGIRRKLLKNVERESAIIAAMQERVRHPILDAYFVYTSFLGTHTFFMITLPSLVFFGYGEVGRGLLMNLAFGVYAASFLKDLLCSPRPYTPPVSRLTMGSHHLEYGFPSTHSANSVSIALYFFTLLRRLYTTPASAFPSASIAFAATASLMRPGVPVLSDSAGQGTMISTTTYNILCFALVFYVFSIVYGRLYTGMHSLTDCVMGVVLGAGIWALNLFFGEPLYAWVRNSGWVVPFVTIPLGLLLVHKHPQPVDDCPCFEDAIAFIAVVMGEILATWYMTHHGYDDSFFVSTMAGSAWSDWIDVGSWVSVASMKMVLGILVIFAWRILAKSLFHLILPPIFRLLAQLFTLPHRRFYTPATDYTSVPPEKGLRPIPSVIDLPGMMEQEMDGGAASSLSTHGTGYGGVYGTAGIKLRNGRVREKNIGRIDNDNEKGNLRSALGAEESGGIVYEVVKRYDADVLTKVFVYFGIGVLASGIIPLMFEVLGWGVRVG